MFKAKFTICISVFILLLIATSVIKNKSRELEKKITNIKNEILEKEKDINEAQLDFYYLSSPSEIEKKLDKIGFNKYQPIEHSKIFLKISDFREVKNKFSTLNDLNEKKIQKRQ